MTPFAMCSCSPLSKYTNQTAWLRPGGQHHYEGATPPSAVNVLPFAFVWQYAMPSIVPLTPYSAEGDGNIPIPRP